MEEAGSGSPSPTKKLVESPKLIACPENTGDAIYMVESKERVPCHPAIPDEADGFFKIKYAWCGCPAPSGKQFTVPTSSKKTSTVSWANIVVGATSNKFNKISTTCDRTQIMVQPFR